VAGLKGVTFNGVAWRSASGLRSIRNPLIDEFPEHVQMSKAPELVNLINERDRRSLILIARHRLIARHLGSF
jgi:hypothetical protein